MSHSDGRWCNFLRAAATGGQEESLEETDILPPPGIIAAEIVEDPQAALTEFSELAEYLQGIGVEIEGTEG